MTLVFHIDAYKDEKYRDEQESRLVAYLAKQDELHPLHLDKKDSNREIIRNFRFNCKALELELKREYCVLPNVDNSWAIKKIFCKNNKTFKSVQSLLKSCSLNEEIRLCMI